MKQNKVVLDFTQINSPEQEVAVMPANLAKKLLVEYATKLVSVSSSEIIDNHINNLKSIRHTGMQGDRLTNVIKCSTEFVQERQLINNIVAENWNAYEVPTQDAATVLEASQLEQG